MKLLKSKYLYVKPMLESFKLLNEGFICSSTEPSSIEVDNNYNQGGEHDGGGNDL